MKFAMDCQIIIACLLVVAPEVNHLVAQPMGSVLNGGNSVQESEGGFLVVGATHGTQLAFDPDDIQSKNSATTYGTLDLNYWGGDVRIGANTLYVDRDKGRIGIKTMGPDEVLDINVGTAASGTEGLRIRYNSGYGGALLAANDVFGGFFVSDGGSNWAPLYAAAFNVISDQKVKKNIKKIDHHNFNRYVHYLENMETASFRYDHEAESISPHIGVIAQTAPSELVTTASCSKCDHQEETLVVNLADWTGLNSVVIKYLLYENRQLKSRLDRISSQLELE